LTSNLLLTNLTKKYFDIPVNLKEGIINEVVNKLGLKSKFQLNDRHEGMFFLDKHIKRVTGCLFLEKCLDINLCDDKKILKCNTEFNIDGIFYIIVFDNANNRVSFLNRYFDFLVYLNVDSNYKKVTFNKLISHDDFFKKSNIPNDLNKIVSTESKNLT